MKRHRGRVREFVRRIKRRASCKAGPEVNKLKKIVRAFEKIVRYGTTDMFGHIFIDTITACNRRCYYCPNSKFDRGSIENVKKMDKELFYKVIDELAELGWQGEICPSFYGEPLLDERLPDLIMYVRSKLPASRINIFTNGDFLTLDMYKKLVHLGVNEFSVTLHPNGPPPFVEDILKYRREHGDDNIVFSYGKLAIMNNRTGLVEIGEEISKYCEVCAQRKVGIHWDGEVIFCCHDYFLTIRLGNIKNERLIDIWNRPGYKQIRNELRKGIFRLQICKKCKYGKVPENKRLFN